MANYGTTSHRPSSIPPTPQPTESKNPSKKDSYTFTLSFPFNIPSTPESAAIRIVRNLERLVLYYAIFIWTVLFITLVPRRKVSLVYLVAMTEVVFLYFLMLRACPDSWILARVIKRRYVLVVLFVITAVELILTEAALHLFVVLAVTLPIAVLHAVLTKTEDAGYDEIGRLGEADIMV